MALRETVDAPIMLHLNDHMLWDNETVVHTGHGDTTTINNERQRVLDRINERSLDQCRSLVDKTVV